jgi:hypothetical protein
MPLPYYSIKTILPFIAPLPPTGPYYLNGDDQLFILVALALVPLSPPLLFYRRLMARDMGCERESLMAFGRPGQHSRTSGG